MLVFMLLTMFMGGAIMLSASLLCLSKAHPTQNAGVSADRVNDVVYDDMELPRLRNTKLPSNDAVSANSESHDKLLEFTCTSGKANKQLPLMGMPDKAFYHIH